MIHRSGVITSREMEAFPAPVKANGRRGPAHRGDVDRRQAGAREPRAHQPGLVMALIRQRRVTLAIDQDKRRAFDVGLRLTVPHQQDVGSARRRHEAALPECGRSRLGDLGIGHEENIRPAGVPRARGQVPPPYENRLIAWLPSVIAMPATHADMDDRRGSRRSVRRRRR